VDKIKKKEVEREREGDYNWNRVKQKVSSFDSLKQNSNNLLNNINHL